MSPSCGTQCTGRVCGYTHICTRAQRSHHCIFHCFTTRILHAELAAISYSVRGTAASQEQRIQHVCSNTVSAYIPFSSCPLPQFCSGGSKAGTAPQPWPQEHHLCCHLTLFTESQNHRMVGVGRDLCGSPSPTLLPKQGHLQ